MESSPATLATLPPHSGTVSVESNIVYVRGVGSMRWKTRKEMDRETIEGTYD